MTSTHNVVVTMIQVPGYGFVLESLASWSHGQTALFIKLPKYLDT